MTQPAMITAQLEMLKTEKHHLTHLTGQFEDQLKKVDEILKKGSDWMKTKGKNAPSFAQMSMMLASCLVEVQKLTSHGQAAKTEEMLHTSSPPPTSSSSSSSSQQQEKQSGRSSTSFVGHMETDSEKGWMARCSVLEEAVYSLRRQVEAGTKQQSCSDQIISDLATKLSVLESKCDDLHKKGKKTAEQQKEGAEKTRSDLSELQKKVDTLENRTSQAETKLSTVTTQLDTVKADKEQAMKELVNGVEQNSSKLKTHERRFKSFESRRSHDMKKFSEQLESVEVQYKAVGKIVSDRVAPLEKLRRIFNNKTKTRDRNVQKLNDLDQKVFTVSAKLTQLENTTTTPRQAVGCNVLLEPCPPISTFTVIKNYNSVFCNIGNSLNLSTGEFVAPTNGLCIVCVQLKQKGAGVLIVGVLHTRHSPGPGERQKYWVCGTRSDGDKDGRCSTGVCHVSTGDKLRVKVYDKTGEASMDSCRFSVCMV